MTDFSEKTHKKIVGSSTHSHHLSKLMETVVPLLFRVSRKMMPRNRLGDRVVSYINFIMNNNRLPKEQLTLNDVLYRIKTTDEILDPLRVFVSDKEFLKVFVSATIGPKFNVPTLDIIGSGSLR